MKKIQMPAIVYILLSAALCLGGCSFVKYPVEYSRVEALMGTFVQVKVSSSSGGFTKSSLKKIVEGAFDEARTLEEKLSFFMPGSEVSALNTRLTRKVSSDLYGLIRESNEISALTGGNFDITIVPVLKRNGFYTDMPAVLFDKIPDSLEGVGWENVRLDGQEIILGNNAWIDLSAIAKGYIADRIGRYLSDMGLKDVMINAGGDIYCGEREGRAGWKIGLRRPGSEDILLTLDLKNIAVATSGDYENISVDTNTGRAVSHIIDPLGMSAKEEVLSSVTVIAPSCSLADALSTAMMAMGGEKAVALADSIDGVDIIAVDCREGTPRILYSKNAFEYIRGR
ncbi:MAG: FAD:protein FMN transferase [Candidatus Omnitrophota bacterium]